MIVEPLTLLGSPIDGDGLLLSFAEDAPLVLLDRRDRSARVVSSGLAEAALTLLLIEPATTPAIFADELAEHESRLAAAIAALGVESLRELSVTDLLRARDTLDGLSYRLVRHVVTENQRIRDTLRMLRDEGPAGIGDLLFESHRSLRDDLRLSRAELDLATEVSQNYGALGARMTGADTVVALVPVGLISQVEVCVDGAFAEHGYAQPEMRTTRPVDAESSG